MNGGSPQGAHRFFVFDKAVGPKDLQLFLFQGGTKHETSISNHRNGYLFSGIFYPSPYAGTGSGKAHHLELCKFSTHSDLSLRSDGTVEKGGGEAHPW